MGQISSGGENSGEIGEGVRLQQFFKFRRRWRKKPGGDQLKKTLAKMDNLIKRFDDEWPLMDAEYLDIPSEEDSDNENEEESDSSSTVSSSSSDNKSETNKINEQSNNENVPPQSSS